MLYLLLYLLFVVIVSLVDIYRIFNDVKENKKQYYRRKQILHGNCMYGFYVYNYITVSVWIS